MYFIPFVENRHSARDVLPRHGHIVVRRQKDRFLGKSISPGDHGGREIVSLQNRKGCVFSHSHLNSRSYYIPKTSRWLPRRHLWQDDDYPMIPWRTGSYLAVFGIESPVLD